MTLISQE